MEKKIVLPKESAELVEALVGIIKVALEQMKDGFQPQDVAPMIAEAFKAMQGEGFKDISKIKEEIEKEPFKFAICLALAVEEVLKK